MKYNHSRGNQAEGYIRGKWYRTFDNSMLFDNIVDIYIYFQVSQMQ
jgi:hypothetical protein